MKPHPTSALDLAVVFLQHAGDDLVSPNLRYELLVRALRALGCKTEEQVAAALAVRSDAMRALAARELDRFALLAKAEGRLHDAFAVAYWWDELAEELA